MKGMTGRPPSSRGGRPSDIAAHASEVAREWEDIVERYVERRNRELGIPDDMNGQPDYASHGRWHHFDPYERQGGKNTTGVVVDSGVLNTDLLKGQKANRIWRKARLRDRIDAIIAHEYEELRAGGKHLDALRIAAKTQLPISIEARRLNRARARQIDGGT